MRKLKYRHRAGVKSDTGRTEPLSWGNHPSVAGDQAPTSNGREMLQLPNQPATTQ
jgi:hypothetical protein